MNKFKYATIIAVVAISGIIGFMSMKKNSPKTELSGLALANVAALTQSESLDCNYNRSDSKCSIYVGAKGSVKLLGGTIVKAGADGYASFDGKVVCSKNGESTCKPVECVDLYSEIFIN